MHSPDSSEGCGALSVKHTWKPGMSELEGGPVELLLFVDGKNEAQSRTCLARSLRETVGHRPGTHASWPTGWHLDCATPFHGQSLWGSPPRPEP